MNKTIEERKKVALQALAYTNFDSLMPNRVEEISKALKIAYQPQTQLRDVKEGMVKWMTENILNIKQHNRLVRNDIEGFCNSRIPAGPSREFIITILKVYSNKLFGERPTESYENYMKNPNPYMNYQMNYMYPNQQYMMHMYPPYPSDQQSYQNMEKMYKMHNPYYMHMPMQYSYPYNDGNRVPYPYSMYPNQPENMADMQNYYAGIRKPTTENQEHPKPVPIPEPKQLSSCSTRSIEEYEQAYKRYQEKYIKESSENPFIITPPSKQTERKKQPQYHHLIPSNPTKNSSLIPKKDKDDDSSEIEVLDKNSEAVKIFKQRKIKDVPFVSEKKVVYDEKFKFCECKGTKNDGQSYKCKDCGVFYHYLCTLKKQKNLKQKNDKSQKEKILQIDIIDEQIAEKPEEGMAEEKEENKPEQEERQEQKEQTCHFCFMRNIDPLNEVIKVAKTCYIRKISEGKILQICNFQPFDSYIIVKNSPYEIELRCMRMEDASNEVPEYTWPDQCLVTLNNEKTIEFPALQQNSSVKKRKDMSVFLTNNIFNYTKNMNQRHHSRIGIEIKFISAADIPTKKIRNNYIFVFGIYLSKKKTVDEIYEEIMMDPTNKVSFVQNYFSMPVDQDEVAIEQIKVSLVDPYTWNLIDTPARGNKCNHGQCFDLKTFLGFMNVQRTRNWKCPICAKECRKFYVDQEQMRVIQEYKKEGDVKNLSKEVTFHRDGRTLFSLNEDSDGQGEGKKQKQPGPKMEEERPLKNENQPSLENAGYQGFQGFQPGEIGMNSFPPSNAHSEMLDEKSQGKK